MNREFLSDFQQGKEGSRRSCNCVRLSNWNSKIVDIEMELTRASLFQQDVPYVSEISTDMHVMNPYFPS